MNSGRAKKLAKALYENLSRRGAKYFKVPGTGQIIREELRRRYQHAKALHNTVMTVGEEKESEDKESN